MDTVTRRDPEATEAELTRLIEKRAAAEDPEALDELWKASVRRHHEAIRRENRAGWYGATTCT